MSWNDLSLNPKVILGYYNQAPSLNDIEIRCISLRPEAATLEIVFEPEQFPERPSPRWWAGANRCQITLRAIDVLDLELSGWGSQVSGDLTICRASNGISISFEGQASLKATCEFIDIPKVSGYIRGEAEPVLQEDD